MKSDYDLVVVGAGPAGMSAAALAAELGASCLLLDEQEEPGGQVYRAVAKIKSSAPDRFMRLGPDFARGARLVEGLGAAGLTFLSSATVWNLTREGLVAFSHQGRSREVFCRNLILATGALERPVPICGWTLPGVMTVGALQILLKSAGLAPQGRFLLAGCGPLLLLLAAQYIDAGITPTAIVETLDWRRRLAALPRLPQAMGAPGYLGRGIAMRRRIRAAGVPFLSGASDLGIEGSERVEALSFTRRGRRQRLAADIVALHQGVVPNLQATRLIECAHYWDARQFCFRPRLDPWGMSSEDGIFVAGDGAGIGGAKAAEHAGRLAALAVARRLGLLTENQRDERAAAERRALARDLRIRPFLERLYAPPPEVLTPREEVTVCRCEEVSAGALREAIALGCSGPNQLKAFLRCGMGPCQGRLCGPTVSALIARERGLDPGAVGGFRLRPPMKPLTLGELASLE